MADWIPCSERLPYAGERVLIWHEKPGANGVVKAAIYVRGDWRLLYGGWSAHGDHVTHWQPLPPPPEPAAAQQREGEGGGD